MSAVSALDSRQPGGRPGKPVAITHGLRLRDSCTPICWSDFCLPQENGAFNIGTGRASTVRSVIEYLASRCGRPDLPQFGALALAPGEPAVLVADMSKMRDRLSWTPQTELHDGLDHVLSSV